MAHKIGLQRIRIGLVLVYFTVIAIIGLPTNSAANTNLCLRYFKTQSASNFYSGDYTHILERIESRFAQSDRVIFVSEKKAPTSRESGEFYASNEMDWHKAPVDKTPADVVIGFGTNNVWDIAVRKNAKTMIIADWSPRPLLLQEYLLKPLILSAKNRFDFLNMMDGFSEVTQKQGQSVSQARTEAAELVLETIASDKRFSVEHMAIVAAYFRLKIEGEHLASAFASSRSHELVDELADFYYQRYDPRSLISGGARPEIVEDPLFSSFSSEQSFQRLRKIFDGNIYYARTEFDHAGFYRSIREKFSTNDYALTITNIIDFAYETEAQPALATFHLRRLVKIVQSHLLSNTEQSVTFFQTRGTMYSHNFQREVFSLHTNPEDMRRIRSPEEDFDPMSSGSLEEFAKRLFRAMRRK